MIPEGLVCIALILIFFLILLLIAEKSKTTACLLIIVESMLFLWLVSAYCTNSVIESEEISEVENFTNKRGATHQRVYFMDDELNVTQYLGVILPQNTKIKKIVYRKDYYRIKLYPGPKNSYVILK